MREARIVFGGFLIGLGLLVTCLVSGCGTLQVGLEITAESMTTNAEVLIQTAISETPGSASHETPSPPPAPTALPTRTPTTSEENGQEGAPLSGSAFSVTGRAMQMDPVSGFFTLLLEEESPLADEHGTVGVRLSEWARIEDLEGQIVTWEDLTRGVLLEMRGQLQNGELVAESAIVLAPGNPKPEDNPAYTQVEARITPLAEAPAGEEDILLFEVLGGDERVDPGASLTLRWDTSRPQ